VRERNPPGAAELRELSRAELQDVVGRALLENPLLNEVSFAQKPAVEGACDFAAVCVDQPDSAELAGGESPDVAPDIFVREIAGEYVVTLNEDGLRLRVSDGALEALGPLESADDGARRFVEAKLHAAAALIAEVAAWRTALHDVALAVVRAQRDFLDGRSKYPRSLSLLEVGGEIGMPVSTLTRVVVNKFIETPQGLFDLTYFFDRRTGSG